MLPQSRRRDTARNVESVRRNRAGPYPGSLYSTKKLQRERGLSCARRTLNQKDVPGRLQEPHDEIQQVSVAGLVSRCRPLLNPWDLDFWAGGIALSNHRESRAIWSPIFLT